MPAAAPDKRVVMVLETLDRMPYWEAAVRVLHAEGWTLDLVSLHGPGAMADAVAGSVAGKHSLAVGSARGYPGAAWRLAALVRALPSPGVVHATGEIASAVAGAAGQLVPQWRVVGHRHHIFSEVPRAMQLLARQLPDVVMACSRAAYAAAQAEGVPDRRLRLATNGVPDPRHVDAVERAEIRRAVGAEAGDVVVVLTARMRPGKGHVLLLDAVDRLPPELYRRLVVLFVGDGAERDRVAARARASSVRVTLAGATADVAPYLAAADIAVVPSRIESFGLTAAEAMAAGLPVIASDVGGLREVVDHPRTGWLVEPGSADALARALRAVLEEPGAAAVCAAAGRRRYEELFTTEAMVRRWTAVYEELLSRR